MCCIFKRLHLDAMPLEMMMNNNVSVDDTVSNDHRDKNNQEDIFSEIASEYMIVEIY